MVRPWKRVASATPVIQFDSLPRDTKQVVGLLEMSISTRLFRCKGSTVADTHHNLRVGPLSSTIRRSLCQAEVSQNQTTLALINNTTVCLVHTVQLSPDLLQRFPVSGTSTTKWSQSDVSFPHGAMRTLDACQRLGKSPSAASNGANLLSPKMTSHKVIHATENATVTFLTNNWIWPVRIFQTSTWMHLQLQRHRVNKTTTARAGSNLFVTFHQSTHNPHRKAGETELRATRRLPECCIANKGSSGSDASDAPIPSNDLRPQRPVLGEEFRIGGTGSASKKSKTLWRVGSAYLFCEWKFETKLSIAKKSLKKIWKNTWGRWHCLLCWS